MQLDLTRYRQPLNHFSRIFQPEDVGQEGDAYRIVAPVHLDFDLHRGAGRLEKGVPVRDQKVGGDDDVPGAEPQHGGVVARADQHVLALLEEGRERPDQAEFAGVGQGRSCGECHAAHQTRSGRRAPGTGGYREVTTLTVGGRSHTYMHHSDRDRGVPRWSSRPTS